MGLPETVGPGVAAVAFGDVVVLPLDSDNGVIPVGADFRARKGLGKAAGAARTVDGVWVPGAFFENDEIGIAPVGFRHAGLVKPSDFLLGALEFRAEAEGMGDHLGDGLFRQFDRRGFNRDYFEDFNGSGDPGGERGGLSVVEGRTAGTNELGDFTGQFRSIYINVKRAVGDFGSHAWFNLVAGGEIDAEGADDFSDGTSGSFGDAFSGAVKDNNEAGVSARGVFSHDHALKARCHQ